MESKVAAFAATPDPTFGHKGQNGKPRKGAPAQPAAANSDPTDLRLVIEEDQAAGTFIYTTIDRVTGEIVQQLPRERVLQLQDDVEYVAGALIRTKA